MSRLFKRIVSVTIAEPIAGKFFANRPHSATVIRDLRVAFDIEKSLESEPNKCTVRLFNLAETSRALVQRKPLHVQIDAGYDGETKRLFAGDLVYSFSRKESVDWETLLEVGDGARAYRHARVNRSFKSVDVKTALAETARSMGLELPTSIASAGSFAQTFTNGLTLSGPSSLEMDRLLKPLGRAWSIQDGRLQIMKPSEARADLAFVVSQDSGLIGVPEFGAPDTKGGKRRLSFQMLLYPDVVPGGRVQLRTKSVNGLFKVERVIHSGDTAGSDWTSSIEAVPV